MQTEARDGEDAENRHRLGEADPAPLATDAGHPFPFIRNLGLNLAVVLHRAEKKRPRFIRIKVPPNRPRWIPVSRGGYVPLEQVIANNLGGLFPRGSKYE